MKHGSLFSGIGGFDLAAQWMGWENIFHCEWNEFGKRILKYYWPKAISYDDIKKTDFTVHRGQINILTGGFPCQPYSTAGKRLGKEDDRHLWPEMLRAIREIKPRWIVAENVYGLLNWNEGLVFSEVQTDLENEGYEVQTYILPAASVNAPHKRDRIWFIGYSNKWGRQEHGLSTRGKVLKNNIGSSRATPDTNKKRFSDRNEAEKGEEIQSIKKGIQDNGKIDRSCSDRFITNTDSELSQGRCSENKSEKTKGHFSSCVCGNTWKNFPTQAPICDGDDGLSGRLDSITFPKWRSESIKGGGNAIVPQVALQIFKAIEKYENYIDNN